MIKYANTNKYIDENTDESFNGKCRPHIEIEQENHHKHTQKL